MLAILKKEINTFFSSPIGYLVIAIFLLLNGLFLWVFKGDFNILDYGFADLSSFFLIALPSLFEAESNSPAKRLDIGLPDFFFALSIIQ